MRVQAFILLQAYRTKIVPVSHVQLRPVQTPSGKKGRSGTELYFTYGCDYMSEVCGDRALLYGAFGYKKAHVVEQTSRYTFRISLFADVRIPERTQIFALRKPPMMRNVSCSFPRIKCRQWMNLANASQILLASNGQLLFLFLMFVLAAWIAERQKKQSRDTSTAHPTASRQALLSHLPHGVPSKTGTQCTCEKRGLYVSALWLECCNGRLTYCVLLEH